MVRRQLCKSTEKSLQDSPVTTIIGPRQCGKTTLARQFINEPIAHFFDLEDPADQFVLEDPVFALQQYHDELVIIDEAQRMLELFPAIRVLVNEFFH